MFSAILFIEAQKRMLAVACCAVVLLFQMGVTAWAQTVDTTLPPVKVGVHVSPPFVIKEGTHYTGMAIELWDGVATDLGRASVYQEFSNVEQLIDATKAGRVDVAVTDLTVTQDRAEILDFSQPWFDAGLTIMTSRQASSFSSLVSDLNDAGHLATFAWIGFVILVASVLLTIFDAYFDPAFPKSRREGFAESFFHVVSIATSGRSTRKNLFGWIGRIWQAFWLVCGVAVIAYVTSSVTSVMTASHIAGQINGVTDLSGKVVGVRRGTVAERYMKGEGVTTQSFDDIDQAVVALRSGDIAAIVADSPLLQYLVHTNTDGRLMLVGSPFRTEKYAFAFTPGSPHAKPASISILGSSESGELDTLQKSYFGSR